MTLHFPCLSALIAATVLPSVAHAVAKSPSAAPPTPSPGEYSYDEDHPFGPSNWADVDVEGNQCSGTSNSPIAVQSGACGMLADYTFTAGTCGVEDMKFVQTNNGVKASYPSNGSCTLNQFTSPKTGKTYEALQFHIHTSSEHTIDDEFFGAELHIVHREVTSGDRFAVVGMMIESGAQTNHPIFNGLLHEWKKAAEATDSECATNSVPSGMTSEITSFNAYDLVPAGSSFFTYDGGLTTPPCSEVVDWNLANKALVISTNDFNMLMALTLDYVDDNTCESGTIASPSGSTSRPVQALNGRTVTLVCPTGTPTFPGDTEVACSECEDLIGDTRDALDNKCEKKCKKLVKKAEKQGNGFTIAGGITCEEYCNTLDLTGICKLMGYCGPETS